MCAIFLYIVVASADFAHEHRIMDNDFNSLRECAKVRGALSDYSLVNSKT